MADRGTYAESAGRGTYGASPPTKSGGIKGIAIVLGIGAAIYLLSPGMRTFYKTGRLPPHPDDTLHGAH